MGWDSVSIYFVRHGQTDWNAQARFQGHLDIPLNDTGRVQAARNGAALAEVIGDLAGFDFVSSPLSRASETMEIVRRALALDPGGYRTDGRLREINVGDYQGRLTQDVFGHQASHAGQRPGDRWDFVHPGTGGESYAMLATRVCEWLEGVETDTVVVAHGGVMRCLRRYVDCLDADEVFRLDAPQDRVMVIRAGALEWI